MSRMQLFGCVAVICGLVLAGASSAVGPQSASADELATTYGGACVKCAVLTGQCPTFACGGDPENPGKFRKIDGTGQAEADCQPVDSGHKETCETNTPLLCQTIIVCDDDACSVNCSSTTATVPTNCDTAGVCAPET